jgi:hypothetical protein
VLNQLLAVEKEPGNLPEKARRIWIERVGKIVDRDRPNKFSKAYIDRTSITAESRE